jgi:hypothetical protein
MKTRSVLIAALALILIGIFTMYHSLPSEAYTGTVEYKALTSVETTTSTLGSRFQGDVLCCVWGTFEGTVYLEIYHTLGSGNGSWIKTGDTWTTEECKVIEIPENGVRLRATSVITSGTAYFRASQEYPPSVKIWTK